MLKKIVLLSIVLGIYTSSQAQMMRKVLKKKTSEACFYINAGYYGNPHYGGGVNINYMWGIGRGKQTFNVGFGMRVNSFFTKNRDYSTSSVELAQLNRGGKDSLFIKKIQTNSLNAYLSIQIHIKRGVDFVLNTDFGGLNFGDSRKGYFHSYETAPVTIYGKEANKSYSTQPYAFNANLWEDNSFGTIMTSAYFSFRCSNFLRWRLGVDYLRNEYKTQVDIPYNGRRFSQRNYMAMTGLAFNLRQHKTTIGPVFF